MRVFYLTEDGMRKDLLGLEGLSRTEIEEILDTACESIWTREKSTLTTQKVFRL